MNQLRGSRSTKLSIKKRSSEASSGFTLIELIIVIAVVVGVLWLAKGLLFGGAAGVSRTEVGSSYQAPVIPLEISIDSRGKVHLKARSGRLPTPIGTFSVYANVSFPDTKTLTVVAGETKSVFDLGQRRFQVNIPNDRNHRSTIDYDGAGNIMVVIPDPVWR